MGGGTQEATTFIPSNINRQTLAHLWPFLTIFGTHHLWLQHTSPTTIVDFLAQTLCDCTSYY